MQKTTRRKKTTTPAPTRQKGSVQLAELLAPNPRNPRKISRAQLDGLRKSIAEFGDLGGIVFNSQTGKLVGGHQRVKVFSESPDAVVTIVNTYNAPGKTGTIKDGFVTVNGERFSYREVKWSKTKETAAMIAANQHGGEFDTEAVSELIREINGKVDTALLGFNDKQLATLLADKGSTLEKLNVTIDEPKQLVEAGSIWKAGHHHVCCLDVFEDWPIYMKFLKPGSLFLPYAGPLALLGKRPKVSPCVIVNPDTYLCGHLLDKWVEAFGTKPIRQ